MPNHCFNDLIIAGNEEDVQAFAALLFDVEHNGDPIPEPFSLLDTFVPIPDDVAATTNGWYEWSIRNRGTKWPEYNKRVVEVSDRKIRLRFDTAWAPPGPALVLISEKFPRLDFVLAYSEEGVGFAGVEHRRAGEYRGGVEFDQCDMPSVNNDDDLQYEVDMYKFHSQLLDIADQYITQTEV